MAQALSLDLRERLTACHQGQCLVRTSSGEVRGRQSETRSVGTPGTGPVVRSRPSRWAATGTRSGPKRVRRGTCGRRAGSRQA